MGRKRKSAGVFNIDYPASYIDSVTGEQVQYHWYKVWHTTNAKLGKRFYEDVTISDEFLHLDTFHIWYKEQESIQGDLSLFEIDKDMIAPKSRIYSRETCLFVPDWLNLQFIERNKARGLYPLGAAKLAKGFVSNITDGTGYRKKYLGYYMSPLEAHRAWQLAKIEHLEGILQRVIEENPLKGNNYKAVEAIQKRIILLQTDYSNGRVTESINNI